MILESICLTKMTIPIRMNINELHFYLVLQTKYIENFKDIIQLFSIKI